MLAALMALGACAGVDEADGERPAPRPAPAAAPPAAPVDTSVRTIQLYQTGQEGSLPVLGLTPGQTLTLEFDLLDEGLGGPLTVYFYHADRHWNRQLLPVEYLRGFQSDDIRDYEASSGTRVRYTHYAYRFPNDAVAFTRSGNFVARVTELGDESAVLFERAFFVSEGTAEVALTLQSGLGAGLGGPFLQPVAQIRPPSRLDSPLYDYDVCFARDGRLEGSRCAGDPTLYGAPTYQFYLPRDRSFPPPDLRFELDLSVLGAGPRIARADLSTDPFRIELAPDDARFGSPFMEEALLWGQPLVRSAVRTVSAPPVQGEYAEVTFRYVPPGGQPFAGRVVVSGTFNGWSTDPRYALTWDPDVGTYTGTFLVKQGKHMYAYAVESRGSQARIARETTLGQPVLYTALVYLRDPSLNTDRLIGVQSLLGQQ